MLPVKPTPFSTKVGFEFFMFYCRISIVATDEEYGDLILFFPLMFAVFGEDSG